MIVALMVVGVLLFIAGIFFAFKGYLAVPSPNAVVPRGDYEIAQKSLRVAVESEVKATSELRSVKAQLELMQKSEQSIRAELDKVRTETNEIRRRSESQLADTLVTLENLKVDQANLVSQNKDLKDQIELAGKYSELIKEKAVDQAKGALEIINDLKVQATNSSELNKLADQNRLFMEKEKVLQQEISRYKIQLSGLERICEDFKKRVEQTDQIEQQLEKAKTVTRSLEKEIESLKQKS